MVTIINSRADLEAIRGTPAYTAYLGYLQASLSSQRDVAVYPPDYHDPAYAGAHIEPVWQEVEDLSALRGLGLTPDDLVVLAGGGA